MTVVGATADTMRAPRPLERSNQRGPALVPSWLGNRSAEMRRSASRLRVVGSEAVWHVVEPRLEPLRYSGSAAKAQALRSVARRLCRSHGVVARIRGTFPDKPVIMVCNHVSYMDPLVVVAMHLCSPVAKAEVSGWPLVGRTLDAFGVNFVSRGNTMSGCITLRRAERALNAGVSVLNFPEGTTTNGDTVLPFHRGMFGLSMVTGVPILPLALRYDSEDLHWVGGETFLPHYMRTIKRESTMISVAIGDLMEPKRFAGPRWMADAAREEVIDLMAHA